MIFAVPAGAKHVPPAIRNRSSWSVVARKHEESKKVVMERVTARGNDETMVRIPRLAGRRGASRFVAAVAKERAARLELLGLLDDLDADHGAPSAAVRAEVARDARRIFRRRR